jgi:hypothetical protein
MARWLRIAVAVALGVCAARGTASAAGPVVLFDEGHGQRFFAGGKGELDLSGLAAAFRAAGLQVRTNSGALDARALTGVSALVISGAFAPLTAAEVEAVHGFLDGGGRLALMLHIGQPLQGLLGKMNIQFSRGPIHESDGLIGTRGVDFSVTRFEPHALTSGLGSLSVFGCWALQTGSPWATVIARTSPRAWLDSDGDGRFSPGEPVGAQGMIVAGTQGAGAFAVFGDDAMFQNRFLKAYNTDAAGRLARWLAGGAPGPAPRRQAPGVIDL